MRRCIVPILAAAVLGCGGEDTIDPQDRVIATGTYLYEGRWLHPGTMKWDTIRGLMVLEVATPDSIHGRWVVAGFDADSVGGYWNENAYVFAVTSANGLITVSNRLSRFGAPSQLRCALSFTEVQDGGPPFTTSGTCDTDLIP